MYGFLALNLIITAYLLDKILKVLVIYIVVVNLCTGIRAEKNYFKNFSTEQFYKLRYSVDFWE